ncbi:histidine kinase [Nonomuraea sp. NPDC051191]|uniref:sensor histidine kinase n=1 Tax=Nonomuraea sp. NPDC051191 TaxID=3364372 RepID=UPI00379DB716
MSSRLLAGSLATIGAGGALAGALMESRTGIAPQEWAYAVLGVVLPALGWLLVVRRADLRYGWLFLAAAACLGLGTLGSGLAIRFHYAGPVVVWMSALYAMYYGLTWIFVPLLFPDGRLPSRRWRPVAWFGGIAIAMHTVGYGLFVTDPARPGELPAELSAALIWASLASALGQLLVFLTAVVVLAGLVVRWRRSEPAERGQYAWMVAGAAVQLLAGVLLLYVLSTRLWGAALIGVFALMTALPAAVLVGIVRYRLLDIRFGLRGSRLHLIFDLRPTVDEVLSGLGTALAATPEPVEQLGRLAAAVRDGLEARWAAVELADGTRVAAGEEEGGTALTVPVRGGLGRIELGPRRAGRYDREDQRFLEALAVPAGLAIQSAGLVARLVNAQEAERRRIERNIHDGVQQQLVALIAGLELARVTGAGPEALARLREQARQTLTDLRELAAGIHPSALSQGGLVEAVEERCSRLPVPTTVTSDPGLRARRFADEIEGAMYFTVSEAVANALKHADAARIEVRLTLAPGRVRATVADDGKGFDPAAAARRGLATLADRLDALGGGMELDSEPGKGTRMHAWVPADA